MAKLKVDLAELTSIATEIRQTKEHLNLDIDAINTAIKKVANSWKTNNMEDFKKKFDIFLVEANVFCNSLENYSSFVENATGIYTHVENTLSKVTENSKNENEWN